MEINKNRKNKQARIYIYIKSLTFIYLKPKK